MNLCDSIREARRVAVPLVYITTPDPTSCIHKLKFSKALMTMDIEEGEKPKQAPIIKWDMEQGLVEENQPGRIRLLEAVKKAGMDSTLPTAGLAEVTKDLNKALKVVKNMPAGVVCFFSFMTPELFFKGPMTLQQIWNLRDSLKSDGTMLAFLGPQVQLPPAIENDILRLDDPYPNLKELEDIVQRQHAAVKDNNENVPDLSAEDKKRAALNMQGLAAFPAETAIAMSFCVEGENFGKIDYKELREQRLARVERQGMTVWKGGDKLSDLGGMEGVKKELLGVIKSNKKRVGGVFYLDEFEKTFAGIGGGDTSGIADDFLGQFLSFTEDYQIMGCLFLGPAGTGKTQVCKAIGNEADIITMAFDINGMKNRYVGSSESNLREAFKATLAISGGIPLFVGSCNSAANLPTSVLRRFRVARIFFDLPRRLEKDIIWAIKLKKYELPEQPLPNDYLWSGAEIDMCCEKAWLRDISVLEAAGSIIAVAKAKPDELEQLRQHAHGTYISAATGRPYDVSSIEQEEIVEKKKERKIHLHS